MPVCELSSSRAPPGLPRPSLDCAVFHVPSSEYLANPIHALTCLARFWEALPGDSRGDASTKSSHLIWTPFYNAELWAVPGVVSVMGSWGLETAGKEGPSVDFCVCLSGTCLFYNSGMTFFQESKYVFVLPLHAG